MIKTKGVLYIVSTPIGNLADITIRAIETLKMVDLIAAEDTRHSRRLLDNYQIKTKMISVHQHNESVRINFLKEQMDNGLNIALISDAGTPLISDPGYRLVAHLRDLGYEIVTIPGASAVIAALSVSGLATDKFYFAGFLSSKSSARKTRLESLKAIDATLICYEAPHRLKKLVEDIVFVMGENRMVCLARELTKKFETVKLSTAMDLLGWLNQNPEQLQGECVVLIAEQEAQAHSFSSLELNLLRAIAEHVPPKIASTIVANYTGLPKKQLYDALINDNKFKPS